MKNVLLLRFGEIYLKGKNRNYFIKTLTNNVKDSLKQFQCEVKFIPGRILVSEYCIEYENNIIENIKKVFGLVSLSKAIEIDTNKDEIEKYITGQLIPAGTFKVFVKRADKKFPIESSIFAAEIGALVLKQNPLLKVDLHSPQNKICVDIRENGKTYIYCSEINCLGGMPVSTSGRGCLLLSGGIDSPVAGFMMAKRGLSLNAVYFHAHPYTSNQAKQKVIDLAKVVSNYSGKINLHIVPFTKIQEEIHARCNPEYTITIMRRFMIKISEIIAKKSYCSCLITGENLAQVASQTVEGITTSNSVSSMPIFRPLIAFDKNEIIEISRKMGAFELSSLPYEDCCTVFVPDKPIIKPTILKCQKEESRINDMEKLIEEAVINTEIIEII